MNIAIQIVGILTPSILKFIKQVIYLGFVLRWGIWFYPVATNFLHVALNYNFLTTSIKNTLPTF